MRIAIHVELERLRIQSGVPRHIREVVGRLLADPSLDTRLFVPGGSTTDILDTLPAPWPNANRKTFPYPGSLMRRLWGTIGWPSFEGLGGQADWLYLPNDSYVPTTSARLAVTVHDLYRLEAPAIGGTTEVSRYQQIRHRLLFRKIAAHADAVLTVSQFTADRFMKHFGVSANRIHVVYNGINDIFFKVPDGGTEDAIRKAVGIDGPYVVNVGGLKAKKNAEGLLNAWKHVHREHPDWSLALVGHNAPGWEEKASGVDGVTVIGRLTDAQLRSLVHFSLCQFLPSWYEGFGLPALETLATGTPVVLSDIPAFRELVGDLGVFVDPARPKQMAEAVMSTATNLDLQTAIRSNGPQHAKRFTWDACARRVRSALS